MTMKNDNNNDPLDVNARLYKQISLLLDDLEAPPVKKKRKLQPGEDPYEEGITFRERLAALIAVGRLQMMFVGLRKEDRPNERNSGSAVRKYKAAFENADSRRKAVARAAAAAAADPFADDDTGGDGLDS